MYDIETVKNARYVLKEYQTSDNPDVRKQAGIALNELDIFLQKICI